MAPVGNQYSLLTGCQSLRTPKLTVVHQSTRGIERTGNMTVLPQVHPIMSPTVLWTHYMAICQVPECAVGIGILGNRHNHSIAFRTRGGKALTAGIGK